MTQPTTEYLFRGNQSACEFADLITNILHGWDDLIDRDKRLTDHEINSLFWRALVELPRNRFYQANFVELNAVLAVAIQNWLAANELEATASDDDKNIAFVIRSSYVDLLIHAATIVGGFEWGQMVTPQIRRFWHNEGLEGYKANLKKQFEDAKELGNGV